MIKTILKIVLVIVVVIGRVENEKQLGAVYDLIARTTPQIAQHFELKYIEKHDQQNQYLRVQYNQQTDKIELEGTDNISLCKAYNTYLQEVLHLQVSFTGKNLKLHNDDQKLVGKEQLVLIVREFEVIERQRQFEFSYSLNICTFDYSFGFWRWEELQEHIDWSAMKGINLMLAIQGQEKVYLKVYEKLGLNEQQLDEVIKKYFTGVGYQAWNRMGNIQGWGGGIDRETLDYQAQLQKNMTTRMRQLGIKTVLPTFNGFVPSQIKDQYPSSQIKKSSNWNKFPSNYTENYQVDVDDPLYSQIQELFISELINEYGTDHFYNGDQYNEVMPLKDDREYLQNSGKKYLDSILKVDGDGVWIMQGWLFYYSRSYWDNSKISSYLSGIDSKHLLILDLYSENHEMISATDGYFGKPFIYNMLHDFGGNHGLYGRLQNIDSEINKFSRQYEGQLKGIGITMEGIFQNYILYDYMLETNWKQQLRLQEYAIKYIRSRYGIINKNIADYVRNLIELVYKQKKVHKIPKNIITMRPGYNLTSIDDTDNYYDNDYDNCQLLETVIIPLFSEYQNLKDKETYVYDLVDSMREYLGNIFRKEYNRVFLNGKWRYRIFDVAKFQAKMLRLIQDLDYLLSFNKQFMLGRWLDSAIKYDIAINGGQQSKERQQQLIRNGKQQVSRWGPMESAVNDYAAKQWNGLMSDYYYQRWKIFVTQLANQILMGRQTVDSVDWGIIDMNLKNFEYYWSIRNNDGNKYQVVESDNGLYSLLDRLINQYKC